MTAVRIQPTFFKYATKGEINRLNLLAFAIQEVGYELGATEAQVQKVPCGKNRERYARVQFRADGKYVGNLML